jgi:DNA topoisomerase IA
VSDERSVLAAAAEETAGIDETSVAAFVDSAHPPIHLLNPDLAPAEFETVFDASRAEIIVYGIIFDAQKTAYAPAVLKETSLTLYRKRAGGRQAGGIEFRGVAADPAGWHSQAPDHGELLGGLTANDPGVLRALATASEGEVSFEIEDCFLDAGQMPLSRLLHLMECAGIGRPSTYAATLKKLFTESEVLTFDERHGTVALTANGMELGARLEARCDDLSSPEFVSTFDRKLDAAGSLAPRDFLVRILSLTRPDDALAQAAKAKLWDSVDELRAHRLANAKPVTAHGYISDPLVKK